MTFQKPYRELSTAEILSKSFDLYFSKFEYFFVPFLLTNIANSILRGFMEKFMPPLDPPHDLAEGFLLWIINYMTVAISVAAIFIIMGWIISTVSNGIAVKYSSDQLEERPTNIREGINFTLSKISSLITAGFITGALMTLGFILFIIPGIIVAIMFSLIVQAIIIERLSVFESLQRSRKLVANRWGKTFTLLFSVFLVIALANLAGYAIGSSVGFLKELIIIVVTSLVQPLHPIAITHLYYSLRAREKPIEQPVPLQPTVPVAPPSTYPPSPSIGVFQPKFCYQCGQKLPPDTIFCPRCGKRVKP